MKTIKELADLIEANPDCEFVIDNDCWWINKADYQTYDDQLAHSRDYEDGEWYDRSGNYGAGLAAAMVELLNRKGFKIKVGGC